MNMLRCSDSTVMIQPRLRFGLDRLVVRCMAGRIRDSFVPMPGIVLATLNAKYIHAAFGLRYLQANLGPLRNDSTILEFDINQRPLDIAEALLAASPRIIGFGVYIWNVALTAEVIATIKQVRPDITIIVGGPEVSYELEGQLVAQLADHVITGEADLKFAEVCQTLLQPAAKCVLPKVIAAELPDFAQLVLPYDLYTDDDIAHRIIYVEASRGCPFTCEFCLSSLDIPVRQVPLPVLLPELQQLLDRGTKHFKFVDRTFNLNVNISRAILEFFLERHRPGQFYHFELVPDRLPESLREIITRFPAGALQFEIGIQTFNEEVGARIKRRQNYERLEVNFRFLRSRTGVHLHADLITGLPGESLESFAAGFDRLIELGPHEIQVGILKRLRGTPIGRHSAEWEMAYSPHPPYEILRNKLIDFATMQRLRRFARYWDLVGNSGNFVGSTPLIWRGTVGAATARSRDGIPAAGKPSPFHSFLRFSDWLYARVGRTSGIALVRLMELLFEYLTGEAGLDEREVAKVQWRDYRRGGHHDKPGFLKDLIPAGESTAPLQSGSVLPKRQARHLAGNS